MKYKTIISFAVLATFFFPGTTHAEIIQGSASSSTSVTTNIQGSGQVHTYIQSTVNGHTKTLESNQPGTYVLNNSDPSSSSTSKSSVTITLPNKNPTPSATPSAQPLKQTKATTATYMDVFSTIRSFFHVAVQDLLSLFHL